MAAARKSFDVSAAEVRREDTTPVLETELPQFLVEPFKLKGLGANKEIAADLVDFKIATEAALSQLDTAQQRFTNTLALNYTYNHLVDLVKPSQTVDTSVNVAKLRPKGQAEKSLESSSESEMLERSVSDIVLLKSVDPGESGEALTVVAQEATIKQLFSGKVDIPVSISVYLEKQATGRRLVVVREKTVSPSFLALTTTASQKVVNLYSFTGTKLKELDPDRRYRLADQGLDKADVVVSSPITSLKPITDLIVVRVPTSPILFQGNGFPFPLREAVSDLRIVIAQQANLGDLTKEENRFVGREFVTPIALHLGPLPEFADRNAESVLLRLIVGFLPLFEYQPGAAGGEVAAADARDLKAMLKVYMHSRELLGFSMIKRTILSPDLIDQDENDKPKKRVASLETAYATMAEHAAAMLRAARWKIGEKKGYLFLAEVAGRKPIDNDVRAFFLRAALGKPIDAKSTAVEIEMMANYPDMMLLLVETLRPAALRIVQQDTAIENDNKAQNDATNTLLINHLELKKVFEKLNWIKTGTAIANLFVTAADVQASLAVDTEAEIQAAKDAFLLGRAASSTSAKKKGRATALKAQTAAMTAGKLLGKEVIGSETVEKLASAAATILSGGAVSVDVDQTGRQVEAQAVGALAADAIAKSTTSDTEDKVGTWTLRTMSDMKNYTALFTDAVRRANKVPEREIKFLLIRLLRSLPLVGTEIPGGAAQIETRIAENFAEVTPIVAEYLAMRLWDDFFDGWETNSTRVAFAEWPYAGLVKLAQLVRRPRPADTDPEALPSIVAKDGVNAKVFNEFVTMAIRFLDAKQEETVKGVLNPAFVNGATSSGAPSLVFWGRSTPYTIGVSDMRSETVYLEFQPLDNTSAEAVFKKHLDQERAAYALILATDEYKAITALAKKATGKELGALAKSDVALDRLLDYVMRSETAALAAQRIRLANGISWTSAADVPPKTLAHLRELVETAILIASDQLGKPTAEETRLLVNYDTLAAAVSIDSVLTLAREMADVVMGKVKAPDDDTTFEKRKKAILNKTVETLLSTHYKTQKLAANLGSEHATAYRFKLDAEMVKAQQILLTGNGRKKRSSPSPPSVEGEEEDVLRGGAPDVVTPAPPSPRIVIEQKEAHALMGQVQALRSENANLAATIKSITDQLGGRGKLGDIVRDLKAENERYKLAAQQAQQATASGAQSEAQLAALLGERAQLLQRVKQAEIALKTSEEGNAKLREQNDELTGLVSDEMAKVQKQTDARTRAEDVARRAEADFASVRAEATKDRARADVLQREKDDLAQQLLAAQGKMTQQQVAALQTVQVAQRQRMEGVVVRAAGAGPLRDILLTPEGLMPFVAFAGLTPRAGQLPMFPSVSVASPHYLIVHFFNEEGREVTALANRNAYVEFPAQESTANKGGATRLFVARMETIIGVSQPGEQSNWIYLRQGGEGNEWRKLNMPIFVPRAGSVTVEYHVGEEMARRLDARVLLRRSVSFRYRVPATEWPANNLAVARLESQDFVADGRAPANALFARVVIHQAPSDAVNDARYVPDARQLAEMMKLDLVLPFLVFCTVEQGVAI
jgi:hypothetical protein